MSPQVCRTAFFSALAMPMIAVALAAAGPRELLLCVTGFPGSTEQARPTVEGFLGALADKLGWGEGSISGDYYPDPADGLEQIRARRPGYAAMSLDLYLAHGDSLEAEVLARAILHGREKQRYHVVVAREGGPAGVESLEGIVYVPFRESVRFLGNLVLDGNRSLAESLDLRYDTNALAALRKVARGQAAAAIVEEEIVERFDEIREKDKLRVLTTGPWLPGPPVVALPGSPPADRAAMREALGGLCSGGGAETCRSIRVDRFAAASSSDYAEAKRLFQR